MSNNMQRAQRDYDNRQPPADDDEAVSAWVDNMAEQLMTGADVEFRMPGGIHSGVKYEAFAVSVDEFVTSQLAKASGKQSVLGRLVIAAMRGEATDSDSAVEEIIGSAYPDETLLEIARCMLRPMAAQGLAAYRREEGWP